MWRTDSRSARRALQTFALVACTTALWAREGRAQEGASPSAPNVSASADEAAVAAFRRGTAAFGSGQFVEAAIAFEEAFDLKPHAAALFNAAKAWARAGSEERAADLFMRALERRELSDTNAVDAREHLGQLRQRLGWVELVGDGDVRVSVGNLKRVGLPVVTHLPVGTHQITWSTPAGESYVREVVVSAAVGTVVRLEPESEEAPSVGPLAATSARNSSEASAASPLDRHQSASPKKAAGFALIGVGGALGLTSVGFGFATLQANGAYRDSDYTDRDARERVVTRKTWTNVLAASAAVVGGVGIVLVTTKQARSSSRIGIRLEADDIVLDWSF